MNLCNCNVSVALYFIIMIIFINILKDGFLNIVQEIAMVNFWPE